MSFVYSVGEYEVYLREGNGFIFYGYEHFANEFSPAKMTSLNLPGLDMALIPFFLLFLFSFLILYCTIVFYSDIQGEISYPIQNN